MKDDASYLLDIVHYAKAAHHFVGDMRRRDFERNELVRLATQKALEVVGEASNKLTPAFRAENPDIEWAKMIAMRATCSSTITATSMPLSFGTS